MRAFIVTTLTLSVAASAFALPAQQNNIDTSKAVAQVMKLEGRWVRAVMRRDAKALERILADDYMGTGSNGKVRDKEQTLRELRTASVGFESITPDNFDVSVDGDMATVTGRVVVTVKMEGHLVASRFSYFRVYVYRKGRWLVTQSRTTRISDNDE